MRGSGILVGAITLVIAALGVGSRASDGPGTRPDALNGGGTADGGAAEIEADELDPGYDARVIASGSLGALGEELLDASDLLLATRPPLRAVTHQGWTRLDHVVGVVRVCSGPPDASGASVWGVGPDGHPDRATAARAVEAPLLVQNTATRPAKVCLLTRAGTRWVHVTAADGAPSAPRATPSRAFGLPTGTAGHHRSEVAEAATRALVPPDLEPACWDSEPGPGRGAATEASSSAPLLGPVAPAAVASDCAWLAGGAVHGVWSAFLRCRDDGGFVVRQIGALPAGAVRGIGSRDRLAAARAFVVGRWPEAPEAAVSFRLVAPAAGGPSPAQRPRSGTITAHVVLVRFPGCRWECLEAGTGGNGGWGRCVSLDDASLGRLGCHVLAVADLVDGNDPGPSAPDILFVSDGVEAPSVLPGRWYEAPAAATGALRLRFGPPERLLAPDRSMVAPGLLPKASERTGKAAGEADDVDAVAGMLARIEALQTGGGQDAGDEALAALSRLDDGLVQDASTLAARSPPPLACGADTQGDGSRDVLVSGLGRFRGAALYVGSRDEAGRRTMVPGTSMTGMAAAHMAATAVAVTGCLVEDVDGDGVVDVLLPTPGGQERGRPAILASAAASGSSAIDVTVALRDVLQSAWDVRPIWLARNGTRHLVAARQLTWKDLTPRLRALRVRLGAAAPPPGAGNSTAHREVGHPDPETPVPGLAELLVLGPDTPAHSTGPRHLAGRGAPPEDLDIPDASGWAAESTPHVVLQRFPVWYAPSSARGLRIHVHDVDGDGAEDVVVAGADVVPGGEPAVARRCGVVPCDGGAAPFLVFRGSGVPRGTRVAVEAAGDAGVEAAVAVPAGDGGLLVVDRGVGGAVWRGRAGAELGWDAGGRPAARLVGRTAGQRTGLVAIASDVGDGDSAEAGAPAGGSGTLGILDASAAVGSSNGTTALPSCAGRGVGRCPDGPVRFVRMVVGAHGASGCAGPAADAVCWAAGAAKGSVVVARFACPDGSGAVDVVVRGSR